MRFLLRLAFWLTVIAILLPGSGSEPASHHEINASEAMSAAKATVGDVRQFCERQPEACTVGSQAAIVLGDRAKAGAKQLYEFLNEKIAPTESDPVATATPGRRAGTIPLPPPRPSQHTLTPTDLAPAWRGPLPHRDARAPAI
jgi:uncharacterized protein DUF5330